MSDAGLIAAHVEASSGFERIRALNEGVAAATPETIHAILDEASKFATAYLAPLNDTGDAVGCRVENSRVRTAPGHRDAWLAYLAAGWGNA